MKMRQWLVSFVAMVALVSAIAVPAAYSVPSSADIQALYRADEVFAQETALVSFGPRVAGSPAELAAAEYIADEMWRFGLDVEIQEFELDYFEELSPPELERVSPSPRTYVEGVDFAMRRTGASTSGNSEKSSTQISMTTSSMTFMIMPSRFPSAHFQS